MSSVGKTAFCYEVVGLFAILFIRVGVFVRACFVLDSTLFLVELVFFGGLGVALLQVM